MAWRRVRACEWKEDTFAMIVKVRMEGRERATIVEFRRLVGFIVVFPAGMRC